MVNCRGGKGEKGYEELAELEGGEGRESLTERRK